MGLETSDDKVKRLEREKRQLVNSLRDIAEQPKPKPNTHQAVMDLVMEDFKARDQLGKERYGTRLQPFNGRNGLRDAYEEALDLAIYLRQVIFEMEGK
jgi:hypothetical protein